MLLLAVRLPGVFNVVEVADEGAQVPLTKARKVHSVVRVIPAAQGLRQARFELIDMAHSLQQSGIEVAH